MRSVHFVSVLALTAVLSGVAPAQQPVAKTMLFGRVTNINGLPLAGVVLTIANSTIRVVSNDSGIYVIESPPTGRVRLMAKRIGFHQQEKGFKIDPGERRQIDYELEGVPEELDSIKIMAEQSGGKMGEFWARRMIGLGLFVTRSDIERRKPFQPSDLLRVMAGVRVLGEDGGLNRPTITMGRTPIKTAGRTGSTTFGSNCVVNYYVDNMWMPSGTFHIDDLSASAIEALEVYRGAAEIPARFRQRETACGLIVIWTRQPPPHRPDTNDVLPSRRF